MALTQIYPSVDWPALPGTDVDIPTVVDFFQRIQAAVRPAEVASMRVRNMDAVRIRYAPTPTSKSAVKTAIQALTAASATGLTPAQVQDLLATLQSVQD